MRVVMFVTAALCFFALSLSAARPNADTLYAPATGQTSTYPA
jgi:hypothetical protein